MNYIIYFTFKSQAHFGYILVGKVKKYEIHFVEPGEQSPQRSVIIIKEKRLTDEIIEGLRERMIPLHWREFEQREWKEIFKYQLGIISFKYQQLINYFFT